LSHQSQTEFLLAQAKFADEQAMRCKDEQARESWQRIAESCRHLAGEYRRMSKDRLQSKPKPR
jgi:hypothetical protein